MSERQVWAIHVMIEATDEDADAALEAIQRALCPDENHPGYCPVPWTLMRSAFGELDPEEQASWQASFDEDRQRARAAGETDAQLMPIGGWSAAGLSDDAAEDLVWPEESPSDFLQVVAGPASGVRCVGIGGSDIRS